MEHTFSLLFPDLVGVAVFQPCQIGFGGDVTKRLPHVARHLAMSTVAEHPRIAGEQLDAAGVSFNRGEIISSLGQ